MSNEIMVSVICNAYNHEKYIRDALDGFVMQKTDFQFEVLIHDDASTDHTADIIREYEAKYPEIIKPIYQAENQYSKDPAAVFNAQYSRIHGKYIALCEGDDYWTDPLKLQKQVDALEQHPEIDVCAHGAIRVEAESKKKLDDIMPSKKDTVLTVQQVIMGTGGYVATNSLLFRTKLILSAPDFLAYLPLDYAQQINASLRGGMLYLADCMSTYRWMSVGSWTEQNSASMERLKQHYCKISIMLSMLDAETDFRFTKTIHKRILLNIVYLYRISGDFKPLLKEENREIFTSLPFITKLEVAVKARFPKLIPAIRALLRKDTAA